MTRDTQLAVLTPGIDPDQLWRVMATALRAPEQYSFRREPHGIFADLNQGLDALMDLRFGERGRLIPADPCDDWCDPDCPREWHDPAHYLMARFDTAYDATDPCGCHSGGIHIRLVSQVGRWLTEHGATWAWYDQSGDGWNHDDDWGTLAMHREACAQHAAIPAPRAVAVAQ